METVLKIIIRKNICNYYIEHATEEMNKLFNTPLLKELHSVVYGNSSIRFKVEVKNRLPYNSSNMILIYREQDYYSGKQIVKMYYEIRKHNMNITFDIDSDFNIKCVTVFTHHHIAVKYQHEKSEVRLIANNDMIQDSKFNLKKMLEYTMISKKLKIYARLYEHGPFDDTFEISKQDKLTLNILSIILVRDNKNPFCLLCDDLKRMFVEIYSGKLHVSYKTINMITTTYKFSF